MFEAAFSRFAILILIGTLGVGCASAPALNPIEPGAELTLARSADPKTTEILVGSDTIGDDAKIGAATGATIAALALVECSMWGIDCLDSGAAWIAASAAGGAIFGKARSWKTEDKDAAASQFIRQLEDRHPEDVVYEGLHDRLGRRWRVIPAGASNRITLSVTEIAVRYQGKGLATIRIRADLTSETCLACQQPQSASAAFTHESPEFSLHSWIADVDGFAARTLDDTYKGLIARIDLAIP